MSNKPQSIDEIIPPATAEPLFKDAEEGNTKTVEPTDPPKKDEEEVADKTTKDTPAPKKEEEEETSKKKDGSATKEDEEYYQDDEGNVVDKEGKIIVAKDKVKLDSDGNVILPEESNSFVNDILPELENQFGIKFGEEGSKFDNTVEGMTKLITETVAQLRQKEENALFATKPVIGDFARHILAGNTPDSFIADSAQTVKYSLPADTDTTDTAIQTRREIVIEEQLLKNGYYNEQDKDAKNAIAARAKNLAELYEDAGRLNEESKLAYSEITKIAQRQKDAQDDANREALKKRQEEDVRYLDTLVNTVKKRDLKGIKVPERDVTPFLEYLTKPVQDGKTKEMLDVDNEELERSLQIAYLRYLNFDFNSLVKNLAADEKANEIRKRVIKLSKGRPGKTDTPKHGTASWDDIRVDKLT